MMLVPCEVRSSPIHGVGLFATTFLPKGTMVWRFDSRIDRVYAQEELASLPPLTQAFLKNYSCWHEASQLWIFCGDNARFVNHAKDCNLVAVNGFGASLAARDIQAGEEITDDYSIICDYTHDSYLSQGESLP